MLNYLCFNQDLTRRLFHVALLDLTVVRVNRNRISHVDQVVVDELHVRNEAFQVDDGLNAAVGTVVDVVALHSETIDCRGLVHRVASKKSDGDPVAIVAAVPDEKRVGAALHCETVVPIVDRRSSNCNVVVEAQVEAVGVLGDPVAGPGIERQSHDRGGDRAHNTECAVRRV